MHLPFTEPNRVKVKTKLKANPQSSTLKISSLETTDTAFFKCQASNDFDTITSQAIVKVQFGKVNLNRKVGHHDEEDDIGLLPETYSSPDFPGMSNVEFDLVLLSYTQILKAISLLQSFSVFLTCRDSSVGRASD